MAQFDSLIEVGIVQNALEAQIRETLNKDYRLKLRVDGGNRNPLGVISRDLSQFEKSLQAAESRVLAFSATAGILYGTTRAITDMVNSTLMFEQALTDINILLNLTDKQLSQFGTSLVSIARNTGQQFSEVAEVAKEFSRQGLGVAETLERTEAALVLVRNSSLSTTEAVSALTAAINSFSSEALTAAEVTNRYAAVDQKFATSSNDLAEAVARVGSTAVDAGLNLNQLLGIVTAVQQTTSRGGAVIGNALKTIFTRIGNNDSIAQLRDLGVNINNTQDGLQKLQAISEAVELNPQFANEIKRVAGGVYQINIVSAALKDLANTYGITQQAIETAENAQNTAFERNERQNKTLASTINATRQNLIALGATLGQGIFGPGIDRFFGRFNDIVKGFEDVSPDSFKGIGLKVGQGIINGLGEFIAGPGAAFASIIAAKLTLKFAKSAQEAFSFRNLFRESGRDDTRDAQLLTAQKAVDVLSKQPQILTQVINGTLSLQDAEQKVLNTILAENAAREKQLQLIAKISAAVAAGSPVVPVSTINPPKGATKRNAYSGVVPSYAEATEKMGALMGGYKPGKVKSKFIKGVGNIVYNDAEKIVNFPGMEQPAIMPPSNSKAGRNYRQKFEKTHGFDPYKAEGMIPKFQISTPKTALNTYGLSQLDWKGILLEIDPQDFLDLSFPLLDPSKESMDNLKKRFESGLPVDPTYLRLAKKKNEVIPYVAGHEGRHRATVAKKLGIKKIPTVFDLQDFGRIPNMNLDEIGNIFKNGLYNEASFSPDLSRRLGMKMQKIYPRIGENKYFDANYKGLHRGKISPPSDIDIGYSKGLIPNFALSPRTILSSDKEGGSLNYNVDTDFGEAIISMISSYGKAGTSKELYPILRSELEKEGIKKVSGYLNAQGLKPRSNSWKDKLTAQFPQLVRGRSFNKNRLLVDDTAFDLAGGDKFDADLEKKASFILNAISKGEGSVKLESFLSNGLIPNFANFDFLNRGSFAEVFRINKGLVGKVFNPEEGFRRTMSEPKLLQMFNKTRDGLIMARNIALSKDLPVKVARTYKPGDFSQFDMYRKDTDAFIKEFGPNVFFQEFIQDKGKSLSKEERARQAYILNKAASKGPNSNPPFGDLIDNPGNFVGDTIIDLLMYGNANQGLVPNYSKLVDYSPALKEAIAREREAGVPPSLIKIGKDSRIKSKQNPSGLGVYNSKDEPTGLKEGIIRAQRQGVDPKIYGTNNASSGLVPNFAKIEFDSFNESTGKFVKGDQSDFAAATQAIGDLKDSVRKGVLSQKTLDDAISNLVREYNLTAKSAASIRADTQKIIKARANQEEKRARLIERADAAIGGSRKGTSIRYSEKVDKPEIPEVKGKSKLLSQADIVSRQLAEQDKINERARQAELKSIQKMAKSGQTYPQPDLSRFTLEEIRGRTSTPLKSSLEAKSLESKYMFGAIGSSRQSTMTALDKSESNFKKIVNDTIAKQTAVKSPQLTYSELRKSQIEDVKAFGPSNVSIPKISPSTPAATRPVQVDLGPELNATLNRLKESQRYFGAMGGPPRNPPTPPPTPPIAPGQEGAAGAPRTPISQRLSRFGSAFANNSFAISLATPILSETAQSFIGDDTLNKRRINSGINVASSTLSFAAAGGSIGLAFGGIGAPLGAGLGAATGFLVSFIDALKNFNNTLPELDARLKAISQESDKSANGLKKYVEATEKLNAIARGDLIATPQQKAQLEKTQQEGFVEIGFSPEQLKSIELDISQKSIAPLTRVLAEAGNKSAGLNIQADETKALTTLQEISLDPSKFFKTDFSFFSPGNRTNEVRLTDKNAENNIVSAFQNILRSTKDGQTLGSFLRSDEFKQSDLGKEFSGDITGKRSFEILTEVTKNLGLDKLTEAFKSIDNAINPRRDFAGVSFVGIPIDPRKNSQELNILGNLFKSQLNAQKQSDVLIKAQNTNTEKSISRSDELINQLDSISRVFDARFKEGVVDAEIALKQREGVSSVDRADKEAVFNLDSTFMSDLEKNSGRLENALFELSESFELITQRNKNTALNDAREQIRQSTGNLVESISRSANKPGVEESTRERFLIEAKKVSEAGLQDFLSLDSVENIDPLIESLRERLEGVGKELNSTTLSTIARDSLKAQSKSYTDIIDKLVQIKTNYDKQNASAEQTLEIERQIAKIRGKNADDLIKQRNSLSFLGGLGGGVRVEAAQNQLFELNNDLDIAQQTDDLNSIQLILNRIAETYKNISVDLPESIRKQLVSVEEASIISLQKKGLFDQTVNPRQEAEKRVQSQFPEERQFNSLPNDRGLQGPPTIPAEFTDRLKQQSNLFTSIEEKNKAIAEIEQIRKRLNQDIANNGLDILQASNQLQQSTQAILALQRQFPDNTVILKSAVDSIRQQEELFSSVAERETFLFDLETKRVDIQKKINLGIIDGVKGQRQYNQEVTESVALQTELAFQANRVGGEAVKAASNANRLAKLNRDGSLSSNDFGQAFTDGFKYNTFDMYKDLNQYATDFGDTFKDAVKGAFAEFQNGTKSAKEALVDLGLSIARNIGNKAFDIGLNNILGATLGNLKFSNGGQVKGYSTGGVVTGGSGVKDDVPAMLTDGEYVVKRAAVKEYGTDFLDQVNQKKVFYDGETTAVSNSDRSFDAVFKNTLQLDDPKNPTKGTLLFDENLSSFAFEDENNPQNERRNRREDLLGSYIRRNKQIMDEYKKRKNNQLNAALIQAGISLAGIGIGQLAGSMGSSSRSVSGATGNTVSSSPYSAGVGYNNTSIGGGFNISPSAPASSLGLSSYDNLKYSQFSGFSSFYSGLRYNRGGKVKKYANGGNVFGGDSYSDRIPALLTDGEYVITKDAVRFYGTDFFNELNSGKINKYALGGQVGPSYPSPVMAQVSDLTPTIEDLNSSIEDLRRAIEDISGGTTDVSSSRAITPANNGVNTAQPQFSISIPITIYNNGENGGTSVSGESRVTSNNTQENNNQNSGSRDKARTDAENAKALGERMLAVAKRAIIEEMRPNGLLENVNKR